MSDGNLEVNRGRQVLVGGAVIGLFGFFAVGLLMGWRYIPGWIGEGVGMLAGLISTPFLMETTFIFLGLVAVMALNIWRRRKAGEEFVSMDITDSTEDGEKR